MMSAKSYFIIKRKFDPQYSILGRYLHSRISDDWKAGSVYILAISVVVLVFVLAQQLSWAIVEPFVTSDPNGKVALAYWSGQVTFAGLILALGVVGFSPLFAVEIRTRDMKIYQDGKPVMQAALEDVDSIYRISAKEYHDVYRRATSTVTFATRVTTDVLVVVHGRKKLVLGLDDNEIDIAAKLLSLESNKRIDSMRSKTNTTAA